MLWHLCRKNLTAWAGGDDPVLAVAAQNNNTIVRRLESVWALAIIARDINQYPAKRTQDIVSIQALQRVSRFFDISCRE